MTAGAVAVAAMMNAVKAIGVIVKVEPPEFLKVLERQSEPLVVHASPKLFSPNHEYVVSYKGLAFYTKSRQELRLPAKTEVIAVKSIFIPS